MFSRNDLLPPGEHVIKLRATTIARGRHSALPVASAGRRRRTSSRWGRGGHAVSHGRTRDMHKRYLGAAAALAALTLTLAACGGSSSGGSSKGGSGGSSAKKVGVILPDASTSPRWEANDRPLLSAAFTSAGLKSDIQNAGGDKSKFGTICDSMINE